MELLLGKDWDLNKILTHLEECKEGCNQEQTRACKAHSYQIQRKASQPGLVWEGKGTLVTLIKDNLFSPPINFTVADRKRKVYHLKGYRRKLHPGLMYPEASTGLQLV